MTGRFFGDFVAGDAKVVVGRAGLFFRTVEDNPARGGGQKIPQAGHCEAVLMDQFLDALDLVDVVFGIAPVVGPRFTFGLDLISQ